MRGILAKKLRKLSGYNPNNREETKIKEFGEKKIGYIDGSGKGNHRVELTSNKQLIAGPKRRLYKLMKKWHKNEEMMNMLIEASIELNNKPGDNNE